MSGEEYPIINPVQHEDLIIMHVLGVLPRVDDRFQIQSQLNPEERSLTFNALYDQSCVSLTINMLEISLNITTDKMQMSYTFDRTNKVAEFDTNLPLNLLKGNINGLVKRGIQPYISELIRIARRLETTSPASTSSNFNGSLYF